MTEAARQLYPRLYERRTLKRQPVPDDDGQFEFVLTTPHGCLSLYFYDFDSSIPKLQRGQLKKIVDEAGNTIQCSYSGDGYLMSIGNMVSIPHIQPRTRALFMHIPR